MSYEASLMLSTVSLHADIVPHTAVIVKAHKSLIPLVPTIGVSKLSSVLLSFIYLLKGGIGPRATTLNIPRNLYNYLNLTSLCIVYYKSVVACA